MDCEISALQARNVALDAVVEDTDMARARVAAAAEDMATVRVKATAKVRATVRAAVVAVARDAARGVDTAMDMAARDAAAADTKRLKRKRKTARKTFTNF